MARRYYSSIAARTTLAAPVNDTAVTLSVVAVSGWPASYPYTLIVDQDTVNEEVVSVTGRTGTTLTVTRGVDGTTAVAHDAGAVVQHGVSAQDFDEPNEFINGTGKILQIVRATDSTIRSTTSTTEVDIAGMTVTITPQKSDSGIIVLAIFSSQTQWSTGDNGYARWSITDSSDNGLPGATDMIGGSRDLTRSVQADVWIPLCLAGYSTPATTSPTLYKLRCRTGDSNTTAIVRNGTTVGQMYAIEVSA